MVFLCRHSTTTQLLECVGDWTLKLSNKKQVDIAYLDFTKAFDSVVHSKLLRKLKCYGFNGLLLDWIKCFLTNRRQMVRVGSSLSHSCNVISGVPHCCVLGRCCLSFILMTYVKSRVMLKMMLPLNCSQMTSRCIHVLKMLSRP